MFKLKSEGGIQRVVPGLSVVFLVSEQLIQFSVSDGVEREKCWPQAGCVINPTLKM